MKENYVYLLILVKEDTKDLLELACLYENGSVKEVYFKKEDAERQAKHLNETFGIESYYNGVKHYSKWIVSKKEIF